MIYTVTRKYVDYSIWGRVGVKELGRMLGVDKSYISKLRSGKVTCSEDLHNRALLALKTKQKGRV